MKKIISLLLTALYLTACNNGTDGTSKQNLETIGFKNPVTPLQKALNQSLRENNTNLALNLYNSIYISPENPFSYKLEDVSGNLISSGDFTCKDISSCIVNIKVTANQSYSLSIFDQNNSFIGANSFVPFPENSYMELSIDDISTSAYLTRQVMNKLQNPFRIHNIEESLFKPVINFKPSLSVNEILYSYFIYLTKTKGLSTTDALSYITNEYQSCEAGKCTLDDDFIKDDSVISNALNKVNEIVSQYAQDKNDESLYRAYLWIKNSKIPSIISSGAGLVDNYFPGASKTKSKEEVGSVFKAIESVFDQGPLKGSKQAYDRAQLFDKNLGIYYTQSPDYLKMINEVTGAILSYQVLNDFNKSYAIVSQDYNIANGHLVMINPETKKYEFTSVEDYIYSYKNLGIPYDSDVFSWIVKNKDSDVGLWDKSSVKDRSNSIDLITNNANIANVALSYKKIFFKDGNPNPVAGVDTIKSRKLYNEALLMSLQRSVNTLQYSMYLDNIALIIRNGIAKEDPIEAANFNRMEIVAQMNGGIDITKGDYNLHQMQLKNYYLNKLNELQQAYKAQILPEKEYVPENVLQVLERIGKCNISYSDGLNVIQAQCPYYYGENNVTKVKYIDSSLDRSQAKCLTTNADGSGGLMAIADVRYASGKLVCLTKDFVRLDLLTNIGIPTGGYEQDNNGSAYTTRFSKSYGAKEYFNDYFLQNKSYFQDKSFDLHYQKGNISYIYIPSPYLINKDANNSYHFTNGEYMNSNPDIATAPATQEPLTIEDKYGNVIFNYYQNNSNAKLTWVSQVSWGDATYLHIDAGMINLYSNQSAQKFDNGFYLSTIKDGVTTKVKIKFETLYTEYPNSKQGGNVRTVFMPIMEVVN